jgi:transcriptional regulator with XRE-family HTH domain
VPLSDSFASRLVDIMEANDWTVSSLANTLDFAVSERTIWRWRAGVAVPGIEILARLARALATTPNALVGWEDEG